MLRLRRRLTPRGCKLGISNISWSGESLPDVLPLIRASGYDGIEIAASLIWEEPAKTSEAERHAVARMVGEAGLEISGLASLLYTRPDLQLLAPATDRQEVVDYLKATIDVCADLGGTYLVLGRPQNRVRGELPLEEAYQRAASVLSALGQHAASAKVVVGLEALPPTICDFITCLRDARAVVDLVNHRSVQVHLDTGAADASGDACRPAIERQNLISQLSSCQVNDFELLPPGSTPDSHHEVWAADLQATGYSGWITVEMRRAPGHVGHALSSASAYVRERYAGLV